MNGICANISAIRRDATVREAKPQLCRCRTMAQYLAEQSVKSRERSISRLNIVNPNTLSALEAIYQHGSKVRAYLGSDKVCWFETGYFAIIADNCSNPLAKTDRLIAVGHLFPFFLSLFL